MKFIHLSDLHLGKRLLETSFLEDQKYILLQILSIIDEEKPDGVIIAGDVYQRSDPPAEAMSLFDDFLYKLSTRGTEVFVISGNHDSPERIAFGSRLMDKSGIHLSPVYNGSIEPIQMEDAFGNVNIYLLPFVKPANVHHYAEEEELPSYTDALRYVVSKMNIRPKQRNVLVTHQFVTGAVRSESEEVNVGGTDNVDASVFAPFDYVALGHIHSPQNCSSDRIRYCGTPLKYSFSEVNDRKSVTVVELGKKGSVSVRTVPLTPMRDMRILRGTYDELMLRSNYEGTTLTSDYVQIILTDEEDIPNAAEKLRQVYKGFLTLRYDNRRTRTDAEISGDGDMQNKSPLQLFSEFYELQNNQPMSEQQTDYMQTLIETIWEDEK